MAEPFLDEVERDAGGDGRHPETVPQPLGRGMRPGEPGALHDGMDLPPGGHAAPGPEMHIASFAALALQLADAVDHVERLEEGRGDGHGAVDAGAAFLEALEDKDASGQIDAIGGEGEGLGQPTSGIGQGHAEGAGIPIAALGGFQEEVALTGGEVFTGAVDGVQLHAGGWTGWGTLLPRDGLP